jgi:ribosomal protein S18 acetylase RimI-like enzyme
MTHSYLDERRCTVDGLAAAAAPLGGCGGVEEHDHTKVCTTPQTGSSVAWAANPPPLEGVKSKKRAVLWLNRSTNAEDCRSLSLSSRTLVCGLQQRPSEARGLLRALDLGGGEETAAAAEAEAPADWQVRSQAKLRVASLSGAALQHSTATEALASASAQNPHVLVVATSFFLGPASAELTAAVAAFAGALLVVVDSDLNEAKVEELVVPLGIADRWALQPAGVAATVPSKPRPLELDLEPSSFEELLDPCALPEGQSFLHDVYVRSPSSPQMYPKPWLEELIEEQLAPLYMEEFGADMANFRQTQRGYGLKLSLLLEERPEEEVPDLLGFLAYKPWGGAEPVVSVCALAVPSKHRGRSFGRQLMQVAEQQALLIGQAAGPDVGGTVRVHSLAPAVRFYHRLGYVLVGPGGADPALRVEDVDTDEDAPCVPMERICRGVSGKGQRLNYLLAGLDAWSPRRSHHLEDGPTWLPVEDFLLPPAEDSF